MPSTGGSSVVQGYFPRGVPHFANNMQQRAAAPPQWVRQAIGGPHARGVTQPRSAEPPQAAPPRGKNGAAIPLPAHLARFSGDGKPLPAAVRQKMEAAFATSFADVRVHVGPEPAAIGALAFTQGSHIHFATGRYDPLTPTGQQILGHELAHVVQQRAGRVRNPFGSGVALVQDAALEAEAERMAARAATQSATIQPKLAPSNPRTWSAVHPATIQRSEHKVERSFTRTAPIELGVRMDNAVVNGKAHAKARITNTAWMIAMMLLMKKRGEIDSKDEASVAKVELQHGRGTEGTQAAHHIILTPSITRASTAPVPLQQLVPERSPLRLLLVMKQAQTTILPIVYNVVDGEIEEDIRDWLSRMYASIVAEDPPISEEQFAARLRHYGNAFFKYYFASVAKRKRWARHEKAGKEEALAGIRRGLLSMGQGTFRTKQEDKAARLQRDLDDWDRRMAVYDDYIAGARELEGRLQMSQFRRLYSDHGTRET